MHQKFHQFDVDDELQLQQDENFLNYQVIMNELHLMINIESYVDFFFSLYLEKNQSNKQKQTKNKKITKYPIQER